MMRKKFELQHAVDKSYGFTIKALGKRAEEGMYNEWLARVARAGCAVTSSFPERDAHGKLHYHGIIQIPKGFWRKRLCIRGMHLKLEEIYNLEGWMKYIRKDQLDIERMAIDYNQYQF